MADPLRVVPISNLPKAQLTSSRLRITGLQRELWFLRREVFRLREAVRQKNDKIRDEVDMWRLGLDHGEWPSMGQVLHLIRKLETAIEYEGPPAPPDVNYEQAFKESR